MNKVKNIKGLLVVAIILALCGITVEPGAQHEPFNRPNPLMDYVSQEIGMYDTLYWELDESDCRRCHGNNLADRHHLSGDLDPGRRPPG